MSHTVTVPQMGESITEGIISRFLVAEGDVVGADTPVFELETDKITTEVPAGASGKVSFAAKEGDTVPVGNPVMIIDTSVTIPASGKSMAAAAPTPKMTPASQPGPAARKALAESGIDPATLNGSGKDGRITKGDVLASVTSAPDPAPAPNKAPSRPEPAAKPASAGTSRTRMTGLRQKIAQRLVQAQQTAAILTTFNEVDLSAVIALRKRHKEAFEKANGVGLGFMSFFTIAAVKALQKYPVLNSQIEGTDIVSFDGIHMGIAVGTDKGLVVPVLRHAEHMGFAEIEASIKGFAAKAKDGKLTIDDLQGGTFTITNGGVYGSLLSTPIINPPQSGILGMHTIKERPVAVDGQVVIRPMMYLALSYDHRIVDGAGAVGFLVRIKDLLEAPEKLLLGL